MKYAGVLRAATLALAVLLLGGATPAVALSLGFSEIEITQDFSGIATVEANFGELLFPQGSGFGPNGTVMLPITDVTSGAVVHATSRIALLVNGGGGDRVVFEGITIDWDTKTAHGGFGSFVGGTLDGDSDADVFDLTMIDATTFQLTWTQAAADVANSVLGTSFAAGTEFGIISLGADPHAVPEAGSMALLASGAFGLALFGMRRRS